MRLLTALVLVACILAVLAGCANRKSTQTSSTKVAAPAEEGLKAVPPTPKPEPKPKPEAAPAPKPTLGKKGFYAMSSGLQYKDKKVGKGAEAVAGQMVTVHYKGWLDDGTVFDTSRSREPFSFALGAGQVIKGWDEGVAGMKVGGIRELIIPAELGYGDQDMGKIPPKSTLHFEVELLKVGG